MVFSSISFLFLFLPIFLSIYYLSPNRYKSLVIVLGSYFFYAWWRVDFLLLFVFITLSNYFIALKIESHCNKKRKGWLILGLVINLSTLGFFKYANFGTDIFVSMLSDVNVDSWLLVNIILPIGISFYIFQAISYLVDVYQKTCTANKSLLDFAAFISLFPQLIAGPVLRYKDIEKQFHNRQHSVDLFSQGCERFMLGFVKKVLIADSIAPIVNHGFLLEDPTFFDAWLTIIAYSAQLYFDFSGYADMAIGLGLMMGFRFMENFNQPYISQSITEFWRRWHISLSSWLKDYLYIPLGGSQNGSILTYRNLMLTMILGGLWHGANWTFIVWGLWHGVLLALEKFFKVDNQSITFNFYKWSLTLFLVMLGWVVFRAQNLDQAMVMYQAMFSFQGFEISSALDQEVLDYNYFTLIVAWLIIVLAGQKQRMQAMIQKTTAIQYPSYVMVRKTDLSVESNLSNVMFTSKALVIYTFFVFSVLLLIESAYSPFLYFQF